MEAHLKIEHLAPYMPYDLQIEPLYQSMGHMGGFHNKTLDISVLGRYELEEIKPILRPLSDLTKEIEHNGEKFVPIDILEWNSYEHIIKSGKCTSVSYSYMIQLFEWHFDVFGLIEKGLAIDINDLNEGI